MLRRAPAIKHADTLCPRGAINTTVTSMRSPEIASLAGELRRRAGNALTAYAGGSDQDPIQWIERGVLGHGATIFEGPVNVT